MNLLALVLALTAFTRPLERVSTIDPALVQSAYDSRAMKLVYQSLLAIDYEKRPYALKADAAELPEVSADGLTYRFTLREARLTADDVISQLRRIRDPKTASPNGYMLAKVAAMRALATNRIEICLKERQHVFPWMLSYIGIRRSDGDGTGPYRLASWRKNHEMVFERRRDAGVGARVAADGFDQIRYLVVDDASTQWLMFLKGEIDMLGEVSRDNWDAIIGDDGRLDERLVRDGVSLCESPTLDVLYLGVNMRDRILGPNRKLRQALNCAFDYPAWEKFYNGRILPCDGPVPRGVEGRLETPFPYAYDLEKARRLLAEAGYPKGIDPKTGRRLTLTLTIGRANQDSREAGELTAAFYEKIGIRLDLAFMTWDAFLKAVNEGRAQLFRMGWVGDYPDAENFLQLFHSRNVSPGANHSNYVNAEFDRAYDAAMSSAGADERNRHWRRCQEIVREDCPWVFTHFPKTYALLHRRVGNYRPSAFPYGNERYLRFVK